MAEDVFGIVGSVIASTYHVQSVVAEGAFGVVYRAHHGGSHAPVALKLLKVPQPNPEQQAAFLRLFRGEAELSFRLAASVESVLRTLHAAAFTGKDGRFVPYLVLEWLDGMTLEALLAQRHQANLAPISLRKWLRLLTPVAHALASAHDFSGPDGPLSIVHGDLKPQKIFIAQVAGEEAVKILDLGIGKVKRAASPGGASMLFTPSHGAPEQWAPRQYGPIGPWTDVWGLALCLVEAMLGRSIIAGEAATMRDVALDARRRPTPRNEGIDLPDAVETVFARALSLDPGARQRHAGIFWNELVAALDQPEPIAQARAIETAEELEFDPSSVRRPAVASVRVSATYSIPMAVATRAQASSRPPSPALPSSPTAGSMRRAAASAPHFVPDLELAPPSVSRRPSGEQPVTVPEPQAAEPSVLDLDDAVLPAVLELDLDLPADEPRPQRSVSSPSFVALAPSGDLPHAKRPSNPPARSHSGSLSAVREPPPVLPVSAVISTRSSNPLPASERDPARAMRASSADVSGPFEAGFVAKIEPQLLEERSLIRRLRPAIALLSAAILVAIVDPIYASATGEVLKIVGQRLSLFAGALLLIALTLAVREVARERE